MKGIPNSGGPRFYKSAHIVVDSGAGLVEYEACDKYWWPTYKYSHASVQQVCKHNNGLIAD